MQQMGIASGMCRSTAAVGGNMHMVSCIELDNDTWLCCNFRAGLPLCKNLASREPGGRIVSLYFKMR
jgi:hypothetical protein